MTWLKSKLIAWLFRSFQKEIRSLNRVLGKKEEDLLLSALYQNEAFRKFIVTRETMIVLSMANEGKKPSDEDYIMSYGRRLEIMSLYYTAKRANQRRQEALAQEQKKDSAPAQVKT